MQEIVLEMVNRFGYWGIGALILIETVFPPIPSEAVLTMGGFLTTCSDLTVPGVILASTLASVKGAFLLYAVGRFLTPQRLGRWFSGPLSRGAGSRISYKKTELEDACARFEKKGSRAVFFGRCIPIVRSLISIPAGMARMDLKRFFLYTAAGSLIWDTALVLLGAVAGQSWEIILRYMDAYSALVKIAAATAVVTLLLRFLWKKRRSTGWNSKPAAEGKVGKRGLSRTK